MKKNIVLILTIVLFSVLMAEFVLRDLPFKRSRHSLNLKSKIQVKPNFLLIEDKTHGIYTLYFIIDISAPNMNCSPIYPLHPSHEAHKIYAQKLFNYLHFHKSYL